MTHDSHSHDETDSAPHAIHGGFGLYMVVGLSLLILTGISFAAPHVFHEPGVMRLVMIVVSCCKATLVILFFMHLKWEANWKYVLTFPAMAMSIFLILMLVPDVMYRVYYSTRERAVYMADPQPGAERAEILANQVGRE